MPALDAFHKKQILVEDLHHPTSIQYIQHRIESERGEDHGMPAKLKLVPGQRPIPSPHLWSPTDTGESVARQMRAALDQALPFYVAPQMHALVTAAAESMPEEEIRPTDLPNPQGFLVIPGGLGMIDIRGQLLKFEAVLWDQHGGGVDLYWLVDKYDFSDYTNRAILEEQGQRAYDEMPQLTIGATSRLTFGHPVPRVISSGMLLPPEVKLDISMDPSTGRFALRIPKGYGSDELKEKLAPSIQKDPITTWLVACWRLMQQTTTQLVPENIPRNLRRSAERRGIRDTMVTVINLRSRPSRGDGSSTVNWSHQWLVRGHWRNQPYKEDGEWIKRWIWIMPYSKGPEDKPLLVREHVYNLMR